MSTRHWDWRKGTLAVAGVLAIAAAGHPCQAGTIRHDRDDVYYRALAGQPQFASVGRYATGQSFGSFTLIDAQWILTAAHVVDTDLDGQIDDESIGSHSISFGGGASYGVAELHVPASWNGNINDGFDIALVKLADPITSITPATIYTGFNELHASIVSVGYGQGGTGKTGATGSSGTKRAGENVIDVLHTFSNGATGLIWDFDEPSPRVSPNRYGSSVPLDLEMNIAPGDSGGGVFLYEAGQWYLAGVHSGTYDFFDYPGAISDRSSYGDASLVTRVTAYQHFINTIIPEPGAGALLLLLGAALRSRATRR